PHLGASGPGPATAVTFNGTDQYALVPRDVRNDFSLEVWFSSHGGGVGTGNTQWWQGAGLLDGETPGVVNDFGTSLDATGQVWAGTGNPDTSIHSAPGFNDGAWHHVVFTRTQATGALTLYLDGVSVASGQGAGPSLCSAPRACAWAPCKAGPPSTPAASSTPLSTTRPCQRPPSPATSPPPRPTGRAALAIVKVRRKSHKRYRRRGRCRRRPAQLPAPRMQTSNACWSG